MHDEIAEILMFWFGSTDLMADVDAERQAMWWQGGADLDAQIAAQFGALHALAAADGVLVPLQAEYYAMEGLGELLRTVTAARKGLNRQLALTGILMTMVDRRTNLSKDVAAEANEVFGSEVFRTMIPRNVRLGEAPSYGRPIHAYSPRCPGALAYTAMARELLIRDGRLDPATVMSHTPFDIDDLSRAAEPDTLDAQSREAS